jgi:hypothetical protein
MGVCIFTLKGYTWLLKKIFEWALTVGKDCVRLCSGRAAPVTFQGSGAVSLDRRCGWVGGGLGLAPSTRTDSAFRLA